MTTGVPDPVGSRSSWAIYLVTAALFCVGGLSVLRWSDTGAGVGYGLLTVAALNLGLALYLRRAAGGRGRARDSC
jgi:hypothetical protein